MLTWGDEYPIHQTPEPVWVAGSDRNFYDRYFFNGYSKDGSVFFGAAFGVYPALNIMDGAFSILKDGVQKSVHLSRIMHHERMDTRVGPMKIEVLQPLHSVKITLDDAEGIAALRKEIGVQVNTEIGNIARPDRIQFTPGLPKTRSGKIMRRILRKVASGEHDQLGDTSTLLDPTVVDGVIAGAAEFLG